MKYIITVLLVITPGSLHLDREPGSVNLQVNFAEATDCSTITGSGNNYRPAGVIPKYRPASDNFCGRL